jgi:DNA-binding beta-propeller fold protein YncE
LVVVAAVVVRMTGWGSAPRVEGASPARITERARAIHHFEYVVTSGEVNIYDIDNENRVVGRINLPEVFAPRGVVASPSTSMLYISYGSQGGGGGTGSMIAYDLEADKIIWQRSYATGVDSIAITPNGRTIYMPVGESSGSGQWEIVDSATGRVTGSIRAGPGAHNTVMSLDGRYVYLAGVDKPYLAVASTATNRVVKEIGPLSTGGRPFTINGAQTLAFTTAHDLLGFQVSSIVTGKVLYTVGVPKFPYDARTFLRSPSHGIALSPDERRIYVIDTPNGYVHAFDVNNLPATRPRLLASIKLKHPPPFDGWLQPSRSGRYLYVGRAGDVIDTKTLRIVAYLPPLQDTATSLEIDWRLGRPVSTTSRYGLGYVR